VTGADGMMRLNPGLVRITDVSFVSWERLPDRSVPDAPIPDLAPDLAIEVLSESNTPAEMARKRREYFAAGVRLVWLVEHISRTVTVFTSVDDFRSFNETDNLDGGNVLPGLSFPVRSIFAELDEHGL
jgi:Uma2 family endonuclease